MTHPQTKDGHCSNCGSQDMFLARDFTSYFSCRLSKNKWLLSHADDQESQKDDGTRFFCSDCGTRHAVPVELAE